MELKEVEIMKDSILPIVMENRFYADVPCSDMEVMKFLQDINEGKDTAYLVISAINWSWHTTNQNDYSSCALYAVKLPNSSYYLTLEYPDLDEKYQIAKEYILRI